MFSVTAKFFIVIHLYTSFSARSARTNILGSVLGCLLTWCIDIAISPLDEVFLDLLRFRQLIISCSFARQIFILGSYILLNSFLLILPFPLFKTYWGEGMRTVGLETSRLRPRLEVLVNIGLFFFVSIFSAVVFYRSFVDLLVMSIYWARIFWYTGIIKSKTPWPCFPSMTYFLQDYAPSPVSYADSWENVRNHRALDPLLWNAATLL